MKPKAGTGWVKDFRDNKDFIGNVGVADHSLLLPEVDLRKSPFMPPTMNQLQTNSCVGNSTSSVFRFMLRKLGLIDFQPSRLLTYYLARAMRGWENDDEGCMPRDAMQSLISNGTVDEALWPFLESEVNVRPPQTLLHNAKQHRIVEGKYVRMLPTDDLFHLKHSLAMKLPFTIGIPCFTSFFDVGSNGIVPMPKSGEKLEGFHMMYTVGYSDSQQLFIDQNSWGEEDGDHGSRYLPYEYVKRYGDDLWRVEGLISN